MRKTRSCAQYNLGRAPAKPSCYEKSLTESLPPQTRKTREHQQGGSTSREDQGRSTNMEGNPTWKEHQQAGSTSLAAMHGPLREK